MPDPNNGGRAGGHKPVHNFHHVVLKAGAPELAVGENVYPNALLPLQGGQNSPVFYLFERFRG
jgi:hypothetical protein